MEQKHAKTRVRFNIWKRLRNSPSEQFVGIIVPFPTSETCNISTQPSRRTNVRTGCADCTRLDNSVKAMENPKALWNKAGKINLRHLVAVQVQNKMAEPNNKNNVDGHCLWKIEQSSFKSTLPSRLEYQEPPLSEWSPSGFPPQPPEKKRVRQIGTMINFTIPKHHPETKCLCAGSIQPLNELEGHWLFSSRPAGARNNLSEPLKTVAIIMASLYNLNRHR